MGAFLLEHREVEESVFIPEHARYPGVSGTPAERTWRIRVILRPDTEVWPRQLHHPAGRGTTAYALYALFPWRMV